MLAVIAGEGALPSLVAQAQSERPLICGVQGFFAEGLEFDLIFRLETIGSLMRDLKTRGVREICLCGAIRRLRFNSGLTDHETRPLVPLIEQALAGGDDGALRILIQLLETQGFVVRAAQDLAPDLLVSQGILSSRQPDEAMCLDAARGFDVLRALAPLDLGQACVVGSGQVWGIETAGGTDHLIGSLPGRAKEANAVLIKGLKRGQDTRADMPTIGPETIASLAHAGLAGLVIQAGAVLVLRREKTIKAADDAGIVLWSRAID